MDIELNSHIEKLKEAISILPANFSLSDDCAVQFAKTLDDLLSDITFFNFCMDSPQQIDDFFGNHKYSLMNFDILLLKHPNFKHISANKQLDFLYLNTSIPALYSSDIYKRFYAALNLIPTADHYDFLKSKKVFIDQDIPLLATLPFETYMRLLVHYNQGPDFEPQLPEEFYLDQFFFMIESRNDPQTCLDFTGHITPDNALNWLNDLSEANEASPFLPIFKALCYLHVLNDSKLLATQPDKALFLDELKATCESYAAALTNSDFWEEFQVNCEPIETTFEILQEKTIAFESSLHRGLHRERLRSTKFNPDLTL